MLTLGAPSVVTIENRQQPTVVLGVPPMHADFIDGKPINFTAAPGGFYTGYKTSDSTEAAASSTHTTSWTFSATETQEEKATLGNCDIGDCFSLDNKTSAKQALDGANGTLGGSFSSSALDISQQTGFYDVLWYQNSTLTIYVYPVIGNTVCPASKPGCTDAEKVPMTVMFAGPDSVNQSKVDAIAMPWYQPPWMPGNLLSYPGTLGQLKAAAFDNPANFQSLTADVSSGRAMAAADKFRVGSNTKTFVVTVLLQLVDEKKLSLDDPLSTFDLGVAVPNTAHITVRQLCNMTSGLFELYDVPELDTLDLGPSAEVDPRQLIALAVTKPVYFPPGQGWHYSNTGHLLLGLVIGCSGCWHGYTGGIPGYNTAAYHLPDQKATILVFVNAQRESPEPGVANSILRDITKVLYPANVAYPGKD